MSKYLVIVESPAKARTIHAILGDDYDVTSSMGHIVDLPAKKLSIDIDNDFAPQYRTIPGKEKTITTLREKAKDKQAIYLATDPDREGEAISWHIKEKLAKQNDKFYRVVFHEITEDALKEAFKKPHQIDQNMVNAQVARRVLDRVVGYYLSPLLWKKVVRGLSAGRVQSVALKFIVDREKEIKKFIPKITYSIEAKFNALDKTFDATLSKFKGKKAEFETLELTQKHIDEIKSQNFIVDSLTKKTTLRKPPAPFTTSLMQQEAFNKLGFSSQKTMVVAQKLYEGINLNGTSVGLITYMRTDSFHVSNKAKKEVKTYIQQSIGKNYLPDKEYRFKEKKGAQLAHEAIRPTSINRHPQGLKHQLSEDEFALYQLIYTRFLAAFMKEAIFENKKLIITGQNCEFSATGTHLVFDGFLKVLGRDEDEKTLPDLAKGDKVTLNTIEAEKHTTRPPARFNDASLVKLLEEKGIGRPSTYAPTIYTLTKRNYVRKERGCFIPTDLGCMVNDLLVEYFSNIIDEEFTAFMEEKLDEVEQGKAEWHKLLKDFFPAFRDKVESVSANIKKEVVTSEKTCPKCLAPLVIKWSRKGQFLSCSTFPACRYGESITTDVVCPDCKTGKLVERRNKRGQFFYGCSNFPNCRFTSRNLPKNASEQATDNTPENDTAPSEN